MSQHNVEDHVGLHPEKPEPMKIEEEFPWFTIIMMIICIITMVGYIMAYIIKNH